MWTGFVIFFVNDLLADLDELGCHKNFMIYTLLELQ